MALARIGVGNAMLFTFALLVVSYRDKARWIQRASAARLEIEEAARKLEALAAAGKIAASVAHEINNPLEAVTNLLFLAQMGNVGESEREYLAMAQKEVGRIASITTHTLRFYRQQSGPAPVLRALWMVLAGMAKLSPADSARGAWPATLSSAVPLRT